MTRFHRDGFSIGNKLVMLGCSLLYLLDNGPMSQKFLSGFCKPFGELDIIRIVCMSPACLLKMQGSCNQCSHGAGKAPILPVALQASLFCFCSSNQEIQTYAIALINALFLKAPEDKRQVCSCLLTLNLSDGCCLAVYASEIILSGQGRPKTLPRT